MKRPDALRIVLDFALSQGDEAVRAAARQLQPVVKVQAPKQSERGFAFADWFRSTLADDVRLAATWREQWAACFDALIVIDGRSPEQIAAVCKWARAHDFWRANFQTPMKLRQGKDGVNYFDRFAAGMKAHPAKRVAQSRGYEIAPGRGPRAKSALEMLKEEA